MTPYARLHRAIDRHLKDGTAQEVLHALADVLAQEADRMEDANVTMDRLRHDIAAIRALIPVLLVDH